MAPASSHVLRSCRQLSWAVLCTRRPTVDPAPDLGAGPQTSGEGDSSWRKQLTCWCAQAQALASCGSRFWCARPSGRFLIGIAALWWPAARTKIPSRAVRAHVCVSASVFQFVARSVCLMADLMDQACNALGLHSQTQHTKPYPHPCLRLSPTP